MVDSEKYLKLSFTFPILDPNAVHKSSFAQSMF
jgi:hypothetical protein